MAASGLLRPEEKIEEEKGAYKFKVGDRNFEISRSEPEFREREREREK